MSTVRVYKSTDPGAPPHPSATRGSMAALLRACLVEGWTSGDFVAEPAGWEEPYPEINNYACFRAMDGARQFYQIDDSLSSSKVAYIYGCESMPDSTTHIAAWGEHYFGKQYDATYSQKWTLIADERTVYLVLGTRYGNIIHGFGEFDSLVPEDPYNSFTAGHGRSDELEYYGSTPFSDSEPVDSASHTHLEMHRSATGNYAANGSICTISGMDSPGGDISSASAAGTGLGWYYIPAFLTCETDGENDLDLVRGKLRGVMVPIARQPLADREVWTDPKTGRTYIAISYQTHASSYAGQYLFDITGDWS